MRKHLDRAIERATSVGSVVREESEEQDKEGGEEQDKEVERRLNKATRCVLILL